MSLGDVGPNGLGFAVAAVGWAAWAGGTPLSMAIASLTEARREHIYQQLTHSGWSHARTSSFVTSVQVAVIAGRAHSPSRLAAAGTADHIRGDSPRHPRIRGNSVSGETQRCPRDVIPHEHRIADLRRRLRPADQPGSVPQ